MAIRNISNIKINKEDLLLKIPREVIRKLQKHYNYMYVYWDYPEKIKTAEDIKLIIKGE